VNRARGSRGLATACGTPSPRGLARALSALAGAAFLACGVAGAQSFETTQIPTVPYSLGAAVSEDNRTLYTVSGNNVIGITDVLADRFVGSIDLRDAATNPSGIAFCHGKLYVECYNNLLVVDAASRSILRSLPHPFILGYGMGDVVVSADGERIYAVAGTSDSLLVLDTRTDEIIGSVVIGRNHIDLSLSPDGTRAYALDTMTATVTMVDLVAMRVIGTASYVGARAFLNLPVDSAMRSDGTLYVAWVDPDYRGHVSLLDREGRITSVFDLPGYSTGIALSLDHEMAFLGGGYVIDADDGTVLSTIPVRSGVSRVAFSPSGERAFVTNGNWLHVLAVSGFRPSLRVVGSPSMGEWVDLHLMLPGEADRRYQVAVARSADQGILLPDGRLFQLDRDDLFRLSIQSSTDPFSGFSGRLNGSGESLARLRISSGSLGRAVGETFYVAFGTFSGDRRSIAEVSKLSNVVPVTILP
jgi:DNA-binding beta-propeller fold protein YncE